MLKPDERPAGPVMALRPDWPAPACVRACTTCRSGGFSAPPYLSLNMADHVGDDPDAVAANRRRVGQTLALPASPLWLRQEHGVSVIDAAGAAAGSVADGAYTTRPGMVCAVLTADCLPLLLCRRAGDAVAAVHVGWRGLAGGIIARAVAALGGAELLAWLGPAIGPRAYQVGEEVVQALGRAVAGAPRDAFTPAGPGKWRVDLYRLAAAALARAGVGAVHGADWCTFTDEQRFYSYRRDGVTGRMATLIWLDDK